MHTYVTALAGALALAALVPDPAAAESSTRSFYDGSGRFAGSSSSRGNSTSVYDRSGRFDGSIIKNSNGTRSYYDGRGRFTGSSTDSRR